MYAPSRLLVGFAVFAAAALAPTRASADFMLIHHYNLNGTLADSLGGPALAANGGTVGATGYTFGMNQGLTLGGWATGSQSFSYAIEMVFRLTQTNGYRKLIDFKEPDIDPGLYVQNGALNFYPAASGGAGVISDNQTVTVKLARNGLTGIVSGYIDDVLQFTFNDSVTQRAIFDGANNLIEFFMDDNGGGEASAGFVDEIKIFGEGIEPVVPLPATAIPAAAMLLVGGLFGRRFLGGPFGV
jgi:hypothetical protein